MVREGEALRLHLIHCDGCREYKHGAEWTILKPVVVVVGDVGQGNEGFDSPPAPPFNDTDIPEMC